MHKNSNLIFHSLPYPAVLLEKVKDKFIVIDLNQSFADTFNVLKNNLEGKPFTEIIAETACFGKDFNPKHILRELKNTFKIKKTSTSDIMEYTILKDEGKTKEIYYAYSVTVPLINSSKVPKSLMFTLPNFSEFGINPVEANILIESGQESLVLVNKNLEIVSLSQSFSEQFKHLFARQVKRGDSILDYTQEQKLSDIRKKYKKVFTGELLEESLSFITPEGDLKHMYLKYSPAKNKVGKVIGAVVSLFDITKFLTQEIELIKSKNKIESIIHSVNGIFWEAQADDLTFTYVSPQVKDILGYTQEEWQQSKTFWLDHIHPDDKSFALTYCKDQVKKGLDHKFEYRMIHKDGKEIWLEDIVTVIKKKGAPTILRGMMIDISKQKQVEKENIDLLARLNERVKEQACLYEISQLSSNPLSEKDLLIKALKIIQKGFQTPEKTEVSITYANDHFKTKGFKSTKKNLIKKGNTFNGNELSISIYQINEKNGDQEFILEENLMIEAISKNLILQLNQKISLDQVEKSHSQLKNIMNQSLDIICTINEEGEFVSVSAASKAVWGYEPKELIGKPFKHFVHHSEHKKTELVSEEVIKGNDVTNFQNTYVRKDGSLVPMIWSAKWNDKEKLMYCVARDGTERKKAEHELTERNKFIETTIESLPIGIAVNFIEDGKVTFMNKNFSKIYGWPEEELTDVNTFFDKVYPDKKVKEEIKKRILDNIESKDLERMNWVGITITTKEGEKKIVTAKNIPLYEQNLMISTVLDITNQKKAEEELRLSEVRFRGIINSQTNYVLRTDLEGNYTFYNDKFKEDFGWVHKTDNLIGLNCMVSILPYHHERVAEVVQKCFETPNKVYQVEIDKPDPKGEVKTRLWDFVCLTDANNLPSEMQCAGIDITARKTAEESLIKKSDLFENLNKVLKKQTFELAKTNKELEEFAYVASHDLQEPLRMVTSFLSKIEEKYNDKLDDKGRQYIHFAVSGARNMRKLILDLLEYSKTGRIVEEPQKIDLNEVVEGILKIYADKIKEKKIKITKDKLPVICVSKTSIYQLFKNLIGNAMHYTHKDRTPKIDIAVSETSEEWTFSIKDNGIGIDPEFHEKIFALFQRLHDSEEFSGTGLGLSICKKIVEYYGGTIKVDSKEGEGATFTFSISKIFASNDNDTVK